MKTRKVFRRLAIVGIALLLMGAFAVPGMAAKYNFSAVSSWHAAQHNSGYLQWYVERINTLAEEKYPGELKVTYKGGPEIVGPTEQLKACGDGVLDIIITAAAYSTSIIPALDGAAVSEFMPWEEREIGAYDYVNSLLQKKANVHLLGRAGGGFYFQIYTNKEIKTMADFKNFKVRTSPSLIPLMKEIGAAPVLMPHSEIYTALERGVIEGFVFPQGDLVGSGMDHIVKYALYPVVPYEGIDYVMINLDKYNKLPKHLQELLDQVGKEVEYYAYERADKLIAEEFPIAMKEYGITRLDMDPAEAEKFKAEAVRVLWGVVNGKAPEEGPALQKLINK